MVIINNMSTILEVMSTINSIKMGGYNSCLINFTKGSFKTFCSLLYSQYFT